MNPFQVLRLAFLFILAGSSALAQNDNFQTTSAPWAKIELGAKYVGWGTNNTGSYGMEALTPLTLSAIPWTGGKIYAQTEFAYGSYSDSVAGAETLNLSGLSDTVVGLSADFKSFSLPSIVNVAVNIPTGDQTWETKQTSSTVPVEFIDGDYRGRGFGMSFLYGLSVSAGHEQYGAAVGYLYNGAFNPYYGLADDQLKLGDSAFISVNHAADRGNGQLDIIRISAFYFLPTQFNGSTQMEMGPNINASYSWQNPKALSFEAGVQYFLPAQQLVNGQLGAEPYNSLGPRFYVTPSYAFGDLTITARAKYVLANGYPQGNVFYDGGGWMLGLEPSLKVKLDSKSALKFTASYDYVTALDYGAPIFGTAVNIDYGHWTFGTNYEVNL